MYILEITRNTEEQKMREGKNRWKKERNEEDKKKNNL
jgi:hypothetical protein